MSVRYRLRPHVLEDDGDGAWAGILPDGPILRVSGSGRWILAILADPDPDHDSDLEPDVDPEVAAGPAGPAPANPSAPTPTPSAGGGATAAQVSAALRRDLLQAPADLEDAVTLFLTAMVRSGLVEAEEAP